MNPHEARQPAPKAKRRMLAQRRAQLINWARFTARRLLVAAGRGRRPDFIIIGAQRSGTTSLYRCLTQLRPIQRALKKEVHFFDEHYARGMHWYQAHFPTLLLPGAATITGEATPDYLFQPAGPARVARELPKARLIVALRNPIDRAYSHYLHEVRKHRETLSFEAALERERRWMESEGTDMYSVDELRDSPRQRFSYLARGLYHIQLRRWLEFFPREQLLVLFSEALFAGHSETLREVLAFLGHPEVLDQAQFRRERYFGPYPSMGPSLRAELARHFAPHNHALAQLLNRPVTWET